MQKITLEPNAESIKTTVDDELLQEHNHQSLNDQLNYRTTATESNFMTKSPKLMIILTILAVVAGVSTGFGTFRLTNKNRSSEVITQPSEGSIKNGDEFGSKDEAFDSNAIGYIEAGGLDGEGSHKLLRPGGDSQTVYLTSSVTDLDLFVGMEVEIWGETFKGQKAGWFMDVGRVKVTNTDGESPAEE